MRIPVPLCCAARFAFQVVCRPFPVHCQAACARVTAAVRTFASRRPAGYSVFVAEPDDLFGAPEPAAPREPGINRPLADRLRPASLSEIVGQDHLLGPEGALIRMLERGSLASLILWGPPGVGKTTIARLLAARAKLAFVQLSAVFSGWLI